MAEADSLWSLVDVKTRSPAKPRTRSLRWVVGAVPILVLLAVLGVAVMIPASLELRARLALFGFGSAIVLWSLSSLNAAYVALGAVLFLVLSRAVEQEQLFEALESDVIWLMIGAFVLGAAVQQTGLATRMTGAIAARTKSVGQLLWLVTTMLLPLSFLIPSTSGRAAVMVPVFRSLSDAAADSKVTRALALLIPTIILVSTIASLTGAGSHLIANDLLDEIVDQEISFLEWLIFGLPFGIAASYVSAFVIGRMFLSPETRAKTLTLEAAAPTKFSRAERFTLVVIIVSVALWTSEALHGLEIATVSVMAAFALTLPGFGAISWKDGLKAVSWNLIIFVGAALVLGETLIETGAAKWLIDQAFVASGLADGGSSMFVLLALALVTLTSHLYMTSHAARAAALVPPLLYLAGALDLQPVAVMFIGTVGMDYCLTFPVSSKALLMFQELDRDTWSPGDLLRLSAVLLPLHAVLMVVFYFGYWRFVGLGL